MILHRHPALIPWLGELFVKIAQFEILAVINIILRVVIAGGDKYHSLRASVIHRSQTHRAGMSHNVKLTVGQMLRAEFGARSSDCNYLSMGRRVMGLCNLIRSLGDNFTIPHYDGGKWSPTFFYVLPANSMVRLTKSIIVLDL